MMRSWRDAVREILASDGRSVAQVKENAAAIQLGPLTAEQMSEFDRILERAL